MVARAPDRREKKARLTEEAAAGWERLTFDHSVTFTTVIEELGQLLAAGDRAWIPDGLIERAKRLDWERFSRRRPPE